MKKYLSNLFILVLTFSFSIVQILANPVVVALPYLSQFIQVVSQALLSIALVAGYYVNVKPNFSSKAETETSVPFEITSHSLQEFLKNVSTKTKIVIKPELLAQLDSAGMHHDFNKLSRLLEHVESINGIHGSNLAQKILNQKHEDINPYLLVPGIKSFKQASRYPGDLYTPANPYSHATENAAISFSVELASYGQSQTGFEPQTFNYKKHVGEPLLNNMPALADTMNSSVPTQQLILNKMSTSGVKKDKTESMRQFINQSTLAAIQAHKKAAYEFQTALLSLIPHFQNPNLRSQLIDYVDNYKKIIEEACQKGATPAIIKAQTKIATQGLPLPGFLQEFSDILQEKVAPICFDNNGNWRGIETAQNLEKFKQAIQAYNQMLSTLSNHLNFQNITQANHCIEDLYIMDQGQGGLFSRFCNWVGEFFCDDSISYSQLRSRILANPNNNQIFTALDLLEQQEFKLARLPLEHMNNSCKTSNSTLLHHKLLKDYQEKIRSHYGNCKIPLIYQNDPVYWLYKPTLSQMSDDDSNIRLIEGHLAIRDSIYQAIINKVCKKNDSVPPLVQHIAYGIIDKLNDPIALIDYVQHLNSNDTSLEIRQAYSAFFDKGVLKLLDLRKQANIYGITFPDSIDLQEYAHIRSAANKLLLIDPQTEQVKQSIQLGLKYIPYACQNDEFAKDYQNMVLAITQAHTQDNAPREILSMEPLEHVTVASSHLDKILLKAAGKAAENDLQKIIPKHIKNSPLTTSEAWSCIRQIQTMRKQSNENQARAIADTYLQGFIDEQMPWKKQIYPAIAAVTVAKSTGAGLWWATSHNRQKQTPSIIPQKPPQKSHLPDDDDDEKNEKEKIHKRTLEDILRDAKQGRTTNGKSKQFEKPGNYEDALSDFKKLNPSNVKDIPIGKMGNLPDGKTVNVRNVSQDGRPTLEILNRANMRKIKIRYGIK